VLRIGELATGCKEFIAVALEEVCATFEPINLRSLFPTFFGEVRLRFSPDFPCSVNEFECIWMHMTSETTRRRYTPKWVIPDLAASL
jgi:hypothetical protein